MTHQRPDVADKTLFSETERSYKGIDDSRASPSLNDRFESIPLKNSPEPSNCL